MTVQRKLHDVAIFNIQDFVEYSQLINWRLQAQNHKQLHFSMMELLLRAACHEIFEEGKQSVEARAEALTEGLMDEEDVVILMR